MMSRPPPPPWCECGKAGKTIKKGPWTPEEDLALVSYVHEHGPGNWRHVPINTGLMRCSKSCRLRWTNYLRPGIRRGGFSAGEDRVIVRLQSLLGNRWAAIASHLPQRTDNDIKNYWNTHLKKKKKKQLIELEEKGRNATPKQQQEAIAAAADHDVTRLLVDQQNSSSSSPSSYPSSMDNISRLLKGFVKQSSPPAAQDDDDDAVDVYHPFLSFDHMTGSELPQPISDDVAQMTTTLPQHQQQVLMDQGHGGFSHEPQQQELSSIEDWLFEEPKQRQQLMESSDDSGCCSLPMFF